MKKCTRCNNVIDWDKAFCPLCGGSVTDVPNTARQEQMNNKFEDFGQAAPLLPPISDVQEGPPTARTEPPIPGVPPVPSAPPLPGPPPQMPAVRAVPPSAPFSAPPIPAVDASPVVPPAPRTVSPPVPPIPGVPPVPPAPPLPGPPLPVASSPQLASPLSQMHQIPGAQPTPTPPAPVYSAPNKPSPVGIISQIHQTPGAGGNFVPPAPPASPTGFFSQIHQSPSKITEPPNPLETNAQTALGLSRDTTQRPSVGGDADAQKNDGANVRSADNFGGAERDRYDPPGAHFAPAPDENSDRPGDGRSKHGNDDNSQPDSEFLRMFPGAKV
jgi:hypothetical protein